MLPESSALTVTTITDRTAWDDQVLAMGGHPSSSGGGVRSRRPAPGRPAACASTGPTARPSGSPRSSSDRCPLSSRPSATCPAAR
ncbi:hypothetical protein NKG05_27055 [Oerskovia sp. M15]